LFVQAPHEQEILLNQNFYDLVQENDREFTHPYGTKAHTPHSFCQIQPIFNQLTIRFQHKAQRVIDRHRCFLVAIGV
jgi:hypothetical protein